jgi:hypothetical protein
LRLDIPRFQLARYAEDRSRAMKPILHVGFSSTSINFYIASKTTWNCPSYFFSSSAGFLAQSLWLEIITRNFQKVFMIRITT